MALIFGLTDYAERHLLGHFLGTETWTAPELWLALGTSSAGQNWAEDGAAANYTEATGGGYARVKLDNWAPVVVDVEAHGDFDSPRATVNPAANTLFPISTAAWSIPSPNWSGIFDAATGGNLLGTSQASNISPSVTVNQAFRQVTFTPAAIGIQFRDRRFTAPGGGQYRRGSLYKAWLGHLLKYLVGEAALPARNFHFCIFQFNDPAGTFGTTEISGNGYGRVSCNGLWTAPATDSDSRASSTLTGNVNFPTATGSGYGTTGNTLGLVNGATGTDWMAVVYGAMRFVAAGNRLVVRPDDLYMLWSN